MLQGGSLPYLKKKGGGADGYIPDFEFIILGRVVSNRAACLYR